jgi:hypothetical protein
MGSEKIISVFNLWAEMADDGLALDIEAVFPECEQVLWDPEPLYLWQ